MPSSPPPSALSGDHYAHGTGLGAREMRMIYLTSFCGSMDLLGVVLFAATLPATAGILVDHPQPYPMQRSATCSLIPLASPPPPDIAF